jgi:hypothetical protein
MDMLQADAPNSQSFSKALTEIISSIETITNAKLVDSARIWIKNKRGLRNQFELNHALELLDKKIEQLKNPQRNDTDSADHNYSQNMVEIMNRIDNISDVNTIEKARSWIKKTKALPDELEFNKAMSLLDSKHHFLSQSTLKAA